MHRISAGWALPRVCALAAICVIVYSVFLRLPMIADDYLQVQLGRDYGPMDRWQALAQDALYRCRATSIVLTYWTERFFGIDTSVFAVSSLFIHFVNTCLVFLAGSWKKIGYSASFAAACFFAAYQRPQEAVIWYAALPELLVFTFVLASLLCWRRFTEVGGVKWYVLTLVTFVLALLSKESAVVMVPLAAGIALVERWPLRRVATAILPFALMAGIYFLGAHADRGTHLHFNDGTFSLAAPFPLTALRSYGRMIWFWSGVAVVYLLVSDRVRHWRWLLLTAVWSLTALLPYSFLTYQGSVPSRHTYLASVGVAFIVARAFLDLRERYGHRPRLVVAITAACLLYQAGYLWYYKHPQYVVRAEPTERLLEAVRDYRGPVKLTCFPYGYELAELALQLKTNGNAWLAKASDQPGTKPIDVNGCQEMRN